MLVLFGGNALSAFRIEALISDCRKLSPGLGQLAARNIYFVDGEVTTDTADKLAGLLDASAGDVVDSNFIVIPREGTISPWASKATDIAHKLWSVQCAAY